MSYKEEKKARVLKFPERMVALASHDYGKIVHYSLHIDIEADSEVYSREYVVRRMSPEGRAKDELVYAGRSLGKAAKIIAKDVDDRKNAHFEIDVPRQLDTYNYGIWGSRQSLYANCLLPQKALQRLHIHLDREFRRQEKGISGILEHYWLRTKNFMMYLFLDRIEKTWE